MELFDCISETKADKDYKRYEVCKTRLKQQFKRKDSAGKDKDIVIHYC